MRDAIHQALRRLQLGSELDVLAAIEILKEAVAEPHQDKRPDYCGSGHCSCIECPYKDENT